MLNWLIGKISDIEDEEYNIIYSSLSDSRKLHIDKKKKEEAKRCSLLATFLLNKLLLEAGQPHAMVETDSCGKPYLKNSELFISISHSGDSVVAALSDTIIGIDIEKKRPIKKDLIDYICFEEEKKYILGTGNILSNDAINRFFEVWTTKEAIFKKGSVKNAGIRSINSLIKNKQTFYLGEYCITIV